MCIHVYVLCHCVCAYVCVCVYEHMRRPTCTGTKKHARAVKNAQRIFKSYKCQVILQYTDVRTGAARNSGHLFSLALVALGLKPQQLSAKWNQAYSLTIMWLRCRLAYSLLRSSVMCIRGARSHLGHYILLHNLLLTWCQGKPFYMHNRFSYSVSFCFFFFYVNIWHCLYFKTFTPLDF